MCRSRKAALELPLHQEANRSVPGCRVIAVGRHLVPSYHVTCSEPNLPFKAIATELHCQVTIWEAFSGILCPFIKLIDEPGGAWNRVC